MESETLRFEDLLGFARAQTHFYAEDVEVLWSYLVTQPTGAARARLLEVEDEEGEFVSTSSLKSDNKTKVLVIRRSSLLRYCSYLRRIRNDPRLARETKGLTVDQYALLMEWSRRISPHLTDYGPAVDTLLRFSSFCGGKE